MGERFNLTAQLQLQAPTNTRQVISQIRSQLQGVTVNVRVEADTRTLSQVNRSLSDINGNARNTATSFGFLNRNLSEAARRFGVITLATGTMLSFAQSVKRAVGDAIAFERQMVTLSQVTGNTVKQLEGVSQEVTRLSTSLGVSSKDLLNVAITLAQAGFSAEETRKSLDILAKTTLGPSFDDVTETVEGAIAVIRQFGDEAIAAGGNVKFLESTLDAINSVSKAFAVESSDLITVIRRTGGVFAAAGGSVNELIALFTSVRATTRESAETIATGLRTIFTRIQRTETVQQLESLGISLRDAEGRFVGAFEAVKRLSAGLSALDPRDIRFSSIVEELGGFRQIGKVIPLIQQFTVAQDALNVAQGASGSVAEDAITAQQALAVQAQKVREEFSALIRQLANSSTFREIATGALDLASALIKIGSALEPVLPLLTSLLALKVGQGLAPGLTALLGFSGGVRRRASGGVIRQFARGGFVPGTGNRDTVPAMLQPGEFVIRKSSVNKIGASNLAAMNENGYNLGGQVKAGMIIPEEINTIPSSVPISGMSIAQANPQSVPLVSGSLLSQLKPKNQDAKSFYDTVARESMGQLTKQYRTQSAGFNIGSGQKNNFNTILTDQFQESIRQTASQFASTLGVSIPTTSVTFDSEYEVPSGSAGTIFEKTIEAFNNSPTLSPLRSLASEDRRPFDFTNGLTGINERLFNLDSDISYIDAKNSADSKNIGIQSYTKKISGQIAIENFNKIRSAIQRQSTRSKGEQKSLSDLPSESGGYSLDTLKRIAGVRSIQELQQAGWTRTDSNRNKWNPSVNKNLGGIIRRFAKGGLADAPMVDDILQATGSILPKPSSAIQALIKSGGGAVDIDRTLKRTVGDIAYAKAKTPEAQQSVLQTYFRDEAKRLQDLKSSSLTQFGQELQNAIKSGQIDPRKISIISKSRRVKGAEDYLSNLFGIPRANMIFTQGGSKQPALDAMRSKGPRADRVQRFALGGGVGTDTVPALLTPGEFVINKKSAQSIGYGNLGRMNKVGKYANGGIVQRFAKGGKSEDTIFSSFVPLGGSSNKFMAALDKATLGLLDFGGVALRQLVTGVTAFSNENKIMVGIMRTVGGGIGGLGDDLSIALNENGKANRRSARQQELLAAAFSKQLADLGETTQDELNNKVEEYIKALEEDTKAKKQSAAATNKSNATTANPTAQAATAPAATAGAAGSSQQDQTLSKLKQYITAKYQAQLNVLASQEALQRRGIKDQTAINQERQRIRQALAQQATAEYQTAKQIASIQSGRRTQSNGPTVAPQLYDSVDFSNDSGNRASRSSNIQQGVQRLDQIAGVAQQFVFLGGAVTTLASQMSGLSDVQKQATAETAGWIASVVGIGGTLIQTMTSLISGFTTQTASSLNAASADLQEASASRVAAGSGAAVVTGFGLGAAAALAIAASFKFAAAESRALAQASKQSAEGQLKNISEGGTTEGFADKQISAVKELNKANVNDRKSSNATTGGLIGAGSGALIGAGIGTLIAPGIGTAIGAAIGGLIGGAGGAFVGFKVTTDNSTKALNAWKETINKSADALAQSVQASFKFNQALQDIDIEKNLKPEERINRRLTAQTANIDSGQLGLVTQATGELSKLSKRAGGKPIQNLQESDFSKSPGAAAAFELNTKLLQQAQANLQQTVTQTRQTLEEAAKIELTGDIGFDEIKNNNGLFAQALASSQQAIRDEATARIAILQAQAATTKDDKARQAINNAIVSTQQRVRQQLQDQENGYRAANEEAAKFKKELEATTLANAEFRKRLLQISAVASSLTNVDNALNKLEKSASNLDSLLSGAKFDFSIDAPEGLTSLENVGDSAAFGAAVDNIAAGLGEEGKNLANNVKFAADIIQKTAQSQLVGVKFTTKEKQPTPEQFLREIGLQPDFLGPALENFKKDFNKNLEDGILQADEAQSLIQPLVEQGKASAEQLKRFNDQQNKAISIYQSFVQQLKDQTDKEIEARQKLVSLVAKTEELRAKARGTELTSDQKESFRLQEAQVGLRGLKDVSGNQLQAGNVQQLSATRSAAFEERASIEADIKAGKVTADRAKREIELNNIIEKTTAELNRLTDQSDKAADILGEIDKERQKRETGKGLVEEFVVGGADQRKAINQAFAGVQAAIKTGTIQNQTPEQRKSTFDLLDKLKDFDFNIGGGRTLKGAQVKEEIIQRDAVRLGLDPKVLRALYGQTDKEKELINALDNLTNTIREAGGANVAFEEQKTKAAQQRAEAGTRELGATGTARPGTPLPATPPGQPAPGAAQAQAAQAAVAAGAAAVQAVNIPQQVSATTAAPKTRQELLAQNKKKAEEDKARRQQLGQQRQQRMAQYQTEQAVQRRGLSDRQIEGRASAVAKNTKGSKADREKARAQKITELQAEREKLLSDMAAKKEAAKTGRKKGEESFVSQFAGQTESPLDRLSELSIQAPSISEAAVATQPPSVSTDDTYGRIPGQKAGESSADAYERLKQSQTSPMSTPPTTPAASPGQLAVTSPAASTAVTATPTAPTSPTAAMGPIPIDTSGLSNVFNAFVGNFSSSLDNIVQKFSGIETAFGSLAQSLTGITMEHTVTVEGLISVGGLNLESIKQELSSSIGQMVAQEITNKMDAESRRFRI
jgi:uncharacterized protein YcfJ